MVSTLIILAVALAALVAVASLLFHNTRPRVLTLSDWEKKEWNIDVGVFRYLVDIDEDRYIAQSLPHNKCAAYRRKRTQLALRIVQLAKNNADMVIRLAALTRAQDDPMLIREADYLIAAATKLRFNLVLARYCLWIRWMVPNWLISVPSLGPQYQRLLDSFARLHEHAWQT